MCFRFIGLDVEPKGINPRSLQVVEVLTCEPIAVGFNQEPEFSLGLDQLGTFPIKLRAAGDVSAGKGNDVSGRTKALGAQNDRFCIQDPRAAS